MVQKLNQIAVEPEVADIVRQGFISYTKVLQEGRFKIADYMNAVMYCSFKLMGHTNQDAWKKTFPDRYTRLRALEATEKEISAYVAAYNRNMLVNKVMEQALIPSWILNQHVFQEAINTQLMLMRAEGVSDKVKTEAANSLLTHLKAPEKRQLDVNINSMPQSNGIDALKDQITALAEMQKNLIAGGVTTRTIAHQPLIERALDQVVDARRAVEEIVDAEIVSGGSDDE